MNPAFIDLYEEIMAMKKDLEEHLKNKGLSEQVKQFSQAELIDLKDALTKLENGSFGLCEDTGIPIPEDLLIFQPTTRSINELKNIMKYLRKPVVPIIE